MEGHRHTQLGDILHAGKKLVLTIRHMEGFIHHILNPILIVHLPSHTDWMFWIHTVKDIAETHQLPVNTTILITKMQK